MLVDTASGALPPHPALLHFRRLQMKRTLTSMILLCAGVAAMPAQAEDTGARSAGFHAVMVDEDFFGAGTSVELDKRVDGDAFLSGGRVAVRGPV